VIRRRDAWEALDLGIALARRHALSCMGATALVSLPVLLLGNALLPAPPWLAPLLMWWLKPLFERVSRHVLGRGLFGEAMSWRTAVRTTRMPSVWALLSALSFGRLSPVRSYLAPVEQLEELRGSRARARRLLLLGDHAGLAVFATAVGLIAEVALWLGAYVLVQLLVPERFEVEAYFPNYDADGAHLTTVVGNVVLWLSHMVVMPFYVAVGFSLYLKRRVDLEGWDLELVFRRLSKRAERMGDAA
jgi:hypothetical protein